MLNNAIIFLLQAILGLLTIAFLLRFYFQLTKVSFHNQVAQMIVSLTNFAVKPMRRIVPSLLKLDLSTLMLAYLTQLILTGSLLWLKGFPLLIVGNQVWFVILSVSLIGIISLSLSIFLYAVLIQAILSWVNPHTPIAPLLNSLTYPILNFLRKTIPPVANFDLSPLVFILAAQLLLTTVLIPLENNLLLTLIS
ncbi:MAG: YggT family protein [Methylotenera sp.]|nr:YggT family protein [Methylotenera sp.]MDP1754821.1 YggT family protein [Methylotenera sp.]MDP1959700.1 YggT family protein [Methylotenera sp.]MDP3207183.1 YggT family protein [Methylotenera sp.]MDP3304250.1 YggT family protein [Methylotenera sp.]